VNDSSARLDISPTSNDHLFL